MTAVDASGNIGRASVDIDPSGVAHKFNDISDYWAADYVDFLYNADITTGYSDGSFRPNQNISRAQFAVMLYRYLKLDENQYANVSLPFADLGSIPAYAIPAVKALYAEGVITGSEKNGQLYFNPGSSLTRAQAAAMIGRTQAKGYALAGPDLYRQRPDPHLTPPTTSGPWWGRGSSTATATAASSPTATLPAVRWPRSSTT